jgi:hypothetical protein
MTDGFIRSAAAIGLLDASIALSSTFAQPPPAPSTEAGRRQASRAP